jgi:hypothetical protein
MHNQIMVQEMVEAIHRERGMTGAARTGWSKRSYRTDKVGLVVGARYVIGNALMRAGRFLQGSAAPRPEPAGPSLV